MPDAEIKLNLAAEFPPTPTAEWEDVIAKDLKGADYEKKLVWRTEEGFSVRPYYRRENLAGLEGQLALRRTKSGWEISEQFAPAADAVRADLLHEGGATAIQELGYGIAEGVEKLAALSEKKPVEEAAGEMEFVFAAGPSYFNEIAKLRAARLLWAQVAAAFGAKSPVAMKIAVRTPRRNKSVFDHNTNLLRATTEALSAVLGGCDALYVEPFGFDRHIAVNIQRILQEESHLDAVADPAGGSYYIESLTDAIAREAWKLFQGVEAEGGFTKAKESGSIGKAIEAARAAREKSLTSRRKALVGVNNFPNLMETAADIQDVQPPKAECEHEYRVATPFEAIRRRTLDFAKAKGKAPKVLLLTRGDVKMKGARSNFALNFFGCAGFAIETSEEYAGSDADLIVLCSSDPEYLAFAKDVCPKVKVPVIVAGNPKDQIEALEAAGVKGFIHVQSDAAATLADWQNKLGME
ncbi:MAG: methylmalonyl-CoA mutase family protein [Acidobacteriota bacterium]|jgi:methylmalonyl-CoA mutase|nr:methylmalonyl-CoA mutase family protein [Acidobacteriota bacterium]